MKIKTDSRLLYLQVMERIKQDIENGIYLPHHKLPSEYELSKIFGVSRATLREALRVLEEESVLVRKHGVGTFIKPKPVFRTGIEQLSSVSEMIEEAGKSPGTIFLSSKVQSPSKEDLENFSITENDKIYVIERIRTANGEPVVYCVDKMPSTYFKQVPSFEDVSFFNYIKNETGRNIMYSNARIEPIGYHDKVSPLLQCEPEVALLLIEQLHYDELDRPLMHSFNYFRSDQFSFNVFRKRF
ncbi:GntR family transcriptional regulator [Bacillus sp. RG28]|uniref:GntR family transcriptional regulator n=1 Tax=Gottfriedia endophytica TaxID=2820819 RepID=A0A940SHG9_9BACI|nr:GntR family transcriptional regulator [Gottfriedia endophytica]MBP0726182.1 GntR family transcriptional regulator [Gottfriedia endophytica]